MRQNQVNTNDPHFTNNDRYYVELHRYAPELTKLHFGDKVLNTGNYWITRNDDPETGYKLPTFAEVVNRHYIAGDLTDEDIQKAKNEGVQIRPTSIENEHNKAFWQGKRTFVNPYSLQVQPVLSKLVQNWDNFHQNIH